MLKGGHLQSMALVPVDEEEQSRCSMESWEYNKALTGPRFYYKKVIESCLQVLSAAHSCLLSACSTEELEYA